MAEAQVLLSAADGPVLRLTLNRPEKRNSLNGALISELVGELRRADEDARVHVVTIEGAGPDFCAGADLEALRKIADADVLENLEDVDRMAELFLLIRRLRKPVVAVVQGRALAGGCGLATACDLVVAAEGAQFGYPEVKIGFVPAMVMAILRRNLGEKKAFEMIAMGNVYSATEAEGMGLVNRVYPDVELQTAAAKLAAELAQRSSSAIMLSKRLFYLQDGLTFEAGIRAGADLNVLARMTEDTRAGVTRFLERGGSKP